MVDSESLTRIVLDERDLQAGLALSDASGWNQTGEDWAIFLRHGRVLGYRAESGQVVATGASLPYGGAQGWISMVLVTPPWRHQGLATALLNDCVAQLQGAGIVPVLDATPAGAQVYRRIGFAPGFEFDRWEADSPAAAPASRSGAVVVARPEHTEAIVALDASANRIERRFLLEAFLARGDTRAWLSADAEGFVIARAGRRATQIGPLVAADSDAAIALLDAALAGRTGPVFLDVPRERTAVLDWLRQRGFRTQRPFLRMARAQAPALACGPRQFAVAGPEFG